MKELDLMPEGIEAFDLGLIPTMITIKKLEVFGILGLNASERQSKQRLWITINLYLPDLSTAAETDDIKDTVDYHSVKQDIIKVVSNSSFKLIETLSYTIAKTLFDHYSIDQIDLSIEKPDVMEDVESVGLSTIFSAEDFGYSSVESYLLDENEEDDDDDDDEPDSRFGRVDFSIN